MKAQVIIDMESFKLLEKAVRSVLKDLGDEDPAKAFKPPNEERDAVQKRVSHAVQGLRQILNFIQPS